MLCVGVCSLCVVRDFLSLVLCYFIKHAFACMLLFGVSCLLFVVRGLLLVV